MQPAHANPVMPPLCRVRQGQEALRVANCPQGFQFSQTRVSLLLTAAALQVCNAHKFCLVSALLVQGANLQSILAQNDSLKVLLDFNMPCTQVSTACMLRWWEALVVTPSTAGAVLMTVAMDARCLPSNQSPGALQHSSQVDSQGLSSLQVRTCTLCCPAWHICSALETTVSLHSPAVTLCHGLMWCYCIYTPSPTVCSADRPLKWDQAGRFWPGEAQPP